MIESISNYKLVDLSDTTFKNSLFLGNWDTPDSLWVGWEDIHHVDWECPKIEDILRFLGKYVGEDSIKIQIFLK